MVPASCARISVELRREDCQHGHMDMSISRGRGTGHPPTPRHWLWTAGGKFLSSPGRAGAALARGEAVGLLEPSCCPPFTFKGFLNPEGLYLEWLIFYRFQLGKMCLLCTTSSGRACGSAEGPMGFWLAVGPAIEVS